MDDDGLLEHTVLRLQLGMNVFLSQSEWRAHLHSALRELPSDSQAQLGSFTSVATAKVMLYQSTLWKLQVLRA